MTIDLFAEKDVLNAIRSWWRRAGKKLDVGLRFADVAAQLGRDGLSSGSADGRSLDRTLQKLRRDGRIVCERGTWRPT